MALETHVAEILSAAGAKAIFTILSHSKAIFMYLFQGLHVKDIAFPTGVSPDKLGIIILILTF